MADTNRVLVANRGEIACRIIESSRMLGLETVAVYSEADTDARHVAMADIAVPIGPAPATESYLRRDLVLDVAREQGAGLVHPGYGFLSEDSQFARAVQEMGLRWIGPSADCIEAMGDKERARDIARTAGVPLLPGSRRFSPGNMDGLNLIAEEIGYPLLVKAAAGGGGIGMQRVDHPQALDECVKSAQSMAAKAFGDASVYLERFVPRARHVEVQVFGFGNGSGVHLFDRDCSLQRRFQKIVEEAPAPGIPAVVRETLYDAALALVERQRYAGAGTVEFIYDVEREKAYFLEMNARIQVEHPVTEMITGIDLVGWQIRQALGQLGSVPQSAIDYFGHAIECRLYAERPEKRFLPSPGTITRLHWPTVGDRLRIDTGVRQGDRVTPYYDPLVAKVVACGEDRKHAIDHLNWALGEIVIEGLHTNTRFLAALLQDPDFRAGNVSTEFVEQYMKRTVT